MEVGQQPGPERVDDSLGHIHLELGVDHARHLAAELDKQTGHNDCDEKRDSSFAECGRDQCGDRCGQRTVPQHVVDHDFQGPGGKSGQPDLSERQCRDRHHPAAIRSQERQRPGNHRRLTPGECRLGRLTDARSQAWGQREWEHAGGRGHTCHGSVEDGGRPCGLPGRARGNGSNRHG